MHYKCMVYHNSYLGNKQLAVGLYSGPSTVMSAQYSGQYSTVDSIQYSTVQYSQHSTVSGQSSVVSGWTFWSRGT